MSLGYLFAAAVAETKDGDSIAGFVMLIGIAWFLMWLFGNKPKGYDFDSRTTGSVRPVVSLHVDPMGRCFFPCRRRPRLRVIAAIS